MPEAMCWQKVREGHRDHPLRQYVTHPEMRSLKRSVQNGYAVALAYKPHFEASSLDFVGVSIRKARKLKGPTFISYKTVPQRWNAPGA